MQKNTNTSPPDKDSDDTLEGLFISPLEDSDSFEKMEAEEARLLSPLRKPNGEKGPDRDTELPQSEGDQISFEAQPSPKVANPVLQEQAILRIAGELRSIKQDLLSIKQLFETTNKNQPVQAPPSKEASATTTMAQMAKTSETSSDTQQLLDDIRKLLLYLDRLLESLPEEKIEEFANSEFFSLYRQIFERLGLS